MKLLFGGLVATILLGLYVYSVYVAVSLAGGETATAFNLGYASTMTTVGGLVSALVIAELAITEPGEVPAARAVGPQDDMSPRVRLGLRVVTTIYLLVWLATGLTAYIVGVMWHPGALQPLTDLGQAWLGLAVTAAYAYLGISRTA